MKHIITAVAVCFLFNIGCQVSRQVRNGHQSREKGNLKDS